MIYGNCIGGVGLERTYILVDENGNEYPAVMVDKETVFDATSNDIRIGKTAATSTGVTVGTKVIPSYNTLEGAKLIPAGSEFAFTIEHYQYTKLQAIICPFNESVSDSVAAERVVVNNAVYPVQSSESESLVVLDDSIKAIKLGITNTTAIPYVIRFFTYKEIY